MDVVSYLLGKQAGGGSSGGLDWAALGYENQPSIINYGYNYAKNIYDNWEEKSSLLQLFKDDRNLIYFPLVNTSTATTMESMFYGCNALAYIPNLDTSNVTTMAQMFYNCYGLQTAPLFDTKNVTNVSSMFNTCYSLKNVPIYDFSKVKNFLFMFANCKSLTDDSLNNILESCTGATVYTGTKTLSQLGFNSTNYPASRIQALSNYDDFIDAGWAIGY